MKKTTLLFFSALLFCTIASAQYTQYVNPFIGTGGHGHTFPGATVPFGMVQLSPDTRPDAYNDWDACGGYHYSDSIVYGFSHTHLSGTGVADYCDILLMPTVGTPQMQNIVGKDPLTGYASRFSHSNEKASPGFYSVMLEDDHIAVELTATARTGMHKYMFPKSAQSNIILDLDHRDQLLEGSYIEVISPTKIQGLRRSSGWAKDQWVYFAIEFSQPFNAAMLYDSSAVTTISGFQFRSAIISSKNLKACMRFNTDGKNPVIVKCALSPVSCAGAWNNMKVENPGWDFELIKQNADQAWNKALGKIEVDDPMVAKKSLSDPDNTLVIFYTALYHCMIAPNIYEDVDDRYRGRDNMIHTASAFDYYTVFSLWDTFRSLHPLFTIIEPDRTNDFINTFLQEYRDGGRLPVWELSSNETNCMIGYHSVSVIADAAVKGIHDYDMNLALAAMKHSANADDHGLQFYKAKGFIESNEEPESVSKTLEYAYDDWCIAQFANHIPTEIKQPLEQREPYYSPDYLTFDRRGLNFMNMINADLLAQPRFNGGWYSPFDPFEVNFNYTEANAWQYSFFYPQYLDRINTNAARKTHEKALDALFTVNNKTTGRDQSDITGLIGQYAHGNEPSHNLAYLFDHFNAAWKTQKYVRQITSTFYKNTPDGLIGNEDCGQMSAWYVLSAMGIYPVCPGKPEYDITTPLFENVIIHLENGNQFRIHIAGEKNVYIKKITLDQRYVNTPFIAHIDIIRGGELDIETSVAPDTAFGKLSELKAPVVPLLPPVISAPSATFTAPIAITMQSFGNYDVHFTTDGVAPNAQSPIYNTAITVSATTTIQAISVDRGTGEASAITTAHYQHIDNTYSIAYISAYNTQYTAGGNTALIDGLRGNVDFRTGMWQGFQGKNMEVVIDLGEKKEISSAGAGFLQDVRSWIWMPTNVMVQVSDNGKKFTTIATINNTVPVNDYESKTIQDLTTTFHPLTTRYIKFIATNMGPVLAGIQGLAEKAGSFVMRYG